MLKPMLAATIDDVAALNFPLMASPKLDGIRCLIVERRPMSRNMKDIQNRHIWHTLYDMQLPALDGELIVGSPTADDCFNRSTSGVMGREGTPKFTYHVFDRHDTDGGFRQRLVNVSGFVRDYGGPLRLVKHVDIRDADGLLAYEAKMLAEGYEGVMVRHPAGLYKNGRATLREGLLSKLKRFADGEAVVIGYVEQDYNGNEATKDALGRTKRSSAKAGKVGKGTLGALQVRDLVTKVEFEIGTGFTDVQRDAIWALRGEALLGRVAKYKHQPVGQVVKPRFPVFLGWRSLADL